MRDFAPPVLVAGVRDAVWWDHGVCENISFEDVSERLGRSPMVMVCHAGSVTRRLAIETFVAFDVLELFAFVRPAQFCLPTPRGMAAFLGLPIPGDREAEAESIAAAGRLLLDQLAAEDNSARAVAVAIAGTMQRGGWPWARMVLESLGFGDKAGPPGVSGGLRVWELLKRWDDDTASMDIVGSEPVGEDETRRRLTMLLGDGAEARPRQADYAAAVAAVFDPRERRAEPNMLLADAATGIGKTLGYIAPASLWSEKNEATVWISTFTRNLQRQLDRELDRLYPDPAEKIKYVVVRKGRENYLCLLNFADAVGRFHLSTGGGQATVLGLLARWLLASRDGDMVGGDFPAWLAGLLGRSLTVELTDTRGECIYSACPHYNKCFVERSIRRAGGARIVVANHALTMIQAARHGGDGFLPSRYIIDEGHHLFDAADSAFSAHLSGLEAVELRHWIVGAENTGRARNRGLRARVDDLLVGNEAAVEIVDELIRAAHALPATGWLQRISGGTATGASEEFLRLVRQQVYARDRNADSPYGLETATKPPVAGLPEAAKGLDNALTRLARPMAGLVNVLEALLDDGAAEMDTATRSRIESVIRGLDRRNSQQVQVWRTMLEALEDKNGEANPDFIDWFGVERIHGRDFDIGLHRHWLDPTRPFAATVLEPAHGVLVTSATLRDCSGDDEADWDRALARTGAAHIGSDVMRVAMLSPFDYAARTRVFVVNDVNRNDPGQVAAAYRELFKAAGGGGLGLFTAISRMRAVHERIARPLDEAGIELMAQHVDPLDIGTLIDIFRADEDSCLLGTDAVRDGIDVPGRSLRLIVFDRMPWPRPNILHKARKAFFGGQYDDMLGRLKLKQAYGRLVRRADDRGVFVMLDRAVPSRLSSAFPEGVEIRRIGLAEAVRETRNFLAG